jgi:uracil-DNA glycosylase
MSTTINSVIDLKMKLYEKLKPSGWADKLKTFMFSEDMDHILETLQNDVAEGKRFTPPLKYVFKAFEECPWSSLKVVMVGQEPNNQLGVADGLAFSCGLTKKADRPLEFMLKEVKETVYTDSPQDFDPNPDLTRWANQGVLLLNSTLTVGVQKPGSHGNVWSDFTKFVLSQLSSLNYAGVVFAFIGNRPQEYSVLVNDNHYKLFAPHPITGGMNGRTSWPSKNLFNEINKILHQIGYPEIVW